MSIANYAIAVAVAALIFAGLVNAEMMGRRKADQDWSEIVHTISEQRDQALAARRCDGLAERPADAWPTAIRPDGNITMLSADLTGVVDAKFRPEYENALIEKIATAVALKVKR